MLRWILLLAPLTLMTTLTACGTGDAPVTDPSKLTPLSSDQLAGLKAADEAVAAEENANPVQPKRANVKR